MRGNVHVRFGGRGRRNGVREIEPPRSAPTLLKQLPKRSGEYLFEIILRRYETKSTMMTSNRPLEDWGKLLGDVPAATAILDRFLHHAEIITVRVRPDRPGPLGLRRPGSDECAHDPFSPAHRSERSRPAPVSSRTPPRSQIYLHGERKIGENEHWLVLTRS